MTDDQRRILLLVVGAPLESERHDRPLALELSRTIADRQSDLDIRAPFEIITCTDVWYLNDSSLLSAPTITIGQPQTNAATAFLSSRVPTALIIDHVLRIHFDAAGIEQQACVWGTNPANTKAAVDAFQQRYLESFLHLAHDLPIQAD